MVHKAGIPAVDQYEFRPEKRGFLRAGSFPIGGTTLLSISQHIGLAHEWALACTTPRLPLEKWG